MRYPQQIVTLKDGRQALLRSPEPREAGAVLDYIRAMSGETEFVGRYPQEITETLAEQEQILRQAAADPQRVQIAAYVDGDLAACATVAPISARLKLRHRADFGIAVLRPYWRLGLGLILTEASIAMARQMGFQQLELSLLATNQAGLALYRQTGFVVWGRLENGFRLQDGSFQPELYMVRHLR